MTGRHPRGCAPLAAITALTAALSTAIFLGVAADPGTARRAPAGRPHGSTVPASTGVWVGTWSASPVAAEPGTRTEGLAGRSVRNVVHTSVGGTRARVTLSNLFGRRPLTLTRASIALAARGAGAAAEPGTMRRLTFGGRTTVAVPAGRHVVSDPVALPVPPDRDVLVSTYSPTPSGPVTHHPRARQTSYAADGDRTEDLAGTAYTDRVDAWRYLTALDVLSADADGTLVTFGDSLTDGSSSSPGENRRWPDVLARRLREAAADGRDVPRYGVANEGISGNRVLGDGFVGAGRSPAGEGLPRGDDPADTRTVDNPSGLRRFSRDVLGRANVKAVVVDLGVNDILRDPGTADADRILDGLRTLVRRAHAHGIRAVGATLMPFHGHPAHTGAREEVRQRINAEIRRGTVFDAVADFDKAVRDPYDPRRLRRDYDCGDHLHPNDRGYERMARTVRLDDLGPAAPDRP